MIADKRAAYLVSCGVNELFHDKELKDFYGDTDALMKVTTYMDSMPLQAQKGLGILLYGSNGTGKSLLMNCAFKDFMGKSKSVLIVGFPTLVSNYVKNWRGEGIMPKLMNVDFLGIDDMGKEFAASDVSKELVTSALDYVIRYRRQRLKPTWITTNHDKNDILTVYGKSIDSLFEESFIKVLVKGADVRRTKAKAKL